MEFFGIDIWLIAALLALLVGATLLYLWLRTGRRPTKTVIVSTRLERPELHDLIKKRLPPSSSTTLSYSTESWLDFSLPEIPLPKRHYRIWFGTNRQPDEEDGHIVGFSGERGNKTTYGFCDVFVPESHKIGSVGSRWYKRIFTSDDRLKLKRLKVQKEDQFWQLVRRSISKAPTGKKHGIVFIHGYRNSFEGAAIRTAQMGVDLGIEGAMAFYSWPSKGTVLGYSADEASIKASEKSITDFLVKFAEKADAEQVHIIAHSMGNRGLLQAIRRISDNAEMAASSKFGQIILAAPDVDVEVFEEFADRYDQVAEGTTLYVSKKDLAVNLSEWLHDFSRVGLHPPVQAFHGIDTVSVENVDFTFLGHGYVADNRPVLTDIHSVLFSSTSPDFRAGLDKKKAESGREYWSIKA